MPEDLSTSPTSVRAAVRKGATPNRSAESAEMARVKRNTGLSGERLTSNSDQMASRCVASTAKNQPSNDPTVTRTPLSVSNCRNSGPRPAPSASRRANSRSRTELRATRSMMMFTQAMIRTSRHHTHQNAQRVAVVAARGAQSLGGHQRQFQLLPGSSYLRRLWSHRRHGQREDLSLPMPVAG